MVNSSDSQTGGQFPNYFGDTLIGFAGVEIPPIVFWSISNEMVRREYERIKYMYIPVSPATKFIYEAIPYIKQIQEFWETLQRKTKLSVDEILQVVKSKFPKHQDTYLEIIYDFMLALQKDEKFMKQDALWKTFSISYILVALSSALNKEIWRTWGLSSSMEYMFNSFAKIFLEWIYTLECKNDLDDIHEEVKKWVSLLKSFAQRCYEFSCITAHFESEKNIDTDEVSIRKKLMDTYIFFKFFGSAYNDLWSYKLLEIQLKSLLHPDDILPAVQAYAQSAYDRFRASKVFQVPVNVEFSAQSLRKIGYKNFITLTPVEDWQKRDLICKITFHRVSPVEYDTHSLAGRIFQMVLASKQKKGWKNIQLDNDPMLGKQVELLVWKNGELYFLQDHTFNFENALYSASNKEVYYFLKMLVFEILSKAYDFRVITQWKKLRKKSLRTINISDLLFKLWKKPIDNQSTPLIRTQELRSLYTEVIEGAREDSRTGDEKFRKVQYTIRILTEWNLPQKEAFEKTPVPLYVYVVNKLYVTDETFSNEETLHNDLRVKKIVISDMSYTQFRTVFARWLKEKYPQEQFLIRFETFVEFKDKPYEPIGTHIKRTRKAVHTVLKKDTN